MLQKLAERFLRCGCAIVLPVMIVALGFATTGCGEPAIVTQLKLIAVAESGDASEVRRLLDDGADPNYQVAESPTALMAASLGGHGAIVDLLLVKGAAVDLQDAEGASRFITRRRLVMARSPRRCWQTARQ